MTELKPILQGRPSRGELRLLGSARIDVPRPGGVARTVAALGLASGVTATAGVSAASASSAGATVIVKWLAIGAVAGAAVTGTGEAVRYRLDASRARAAAVRAETESESRARPAPRANAAPMRSQAPESPPTPEAPADPRVVSAFPNAAVPNANADAPRTMRMEPRLEPFASAEFATQPTLAEEVRTLDGVRRLLAAGDARAALASLDALARKVRAPKLGPEATLLRAQALTALGRSDEARRLTETP